MKRILLLLSAVALSGCIHLLPKAPPPPRTFVMAAGDVAQANGAPVDAVINVADPSGERSILGNLLVWRTGDEIAYVAGTAWSTRAEDALQQMLVETLSRQQRFRAAARTGEAAGAYEVRWEILEFDVQQNDMQAHFRADVKLVASPGRRVIAQKMVDAHAPVGDRSSSLASQGLTAAARDASMQIAQFAADAALQDQLTQPAQDAPRAQPH
ncbi:MAG: ABC-type transport auxiliary lipoprotein family protein [Terricaulis sp.]